MIISTCTNSEDIGCIWAKEHEHRGHLSQRQPNTYTPSAKAIPDQDPSWHYKANSPVCSKQDHMLSCLIEGLKQATTKCVNYDKFKEITKGQMKILPFSSLSSCRLFSSTLT